MLEPSDVDRAVARVEFQVSLEAKRLIVLLFNTPETDPHPTWKVGPELSQYYAQAERRLPALLNQLAEDLFINRGGLITAIDVAYWFGRRPERIRDLGPQACVFPGLDPGDPNPGRITARLPFPFNMEPPER
jgi:hypothetical protein